MGSRFRGTETEGLLAGLLVLPWWRSWLAAGVTHTVREGEEECRAAGLRELCAPKLSLNVADCCPGRWGGRSGEGCRPSALSPGFRLFCRRRRCWLVRDWLGVSGEMVWAGGGGVGVRPLSWRACKNCTAASKRCCGTGGGGPCEVRWGVRRGPGCEASPMRAPSCQLWLVGSKAAGGWGG